MTDTPTADDAIPIEPGTVVYDGDGARLGVISGFTAAGFEVAITADVDGDEEGRVEITEPDAGSDEAVTVGQESHRTADQRPEAGNESGEGSLTWRCEACGEMGDLDAGLPEECPNCGSADVYRRKEA